MTDDRYLEHSKGPWKKHKYIRKDGKRYIYNNGSKGNIRGKSVKSSYDKEKTFWDEIDKNYIERLGRSPKQLLNSQDFAITLMEFGGYDTDSMSPKEIERLKKRFKKRYNIHDNDFNGMPSSVAEKRKKKPNRGGRMGNGMPSDVTERMRHCDMNYGYLVHSKGPWKKHKYLSKVGNKYVYAKNQIVNGIHGFGARLRKKVRKKVGLEARDEFMKRAAIEEPVISEFNRNAKYKHLDGERNVAYRMYKDSEAKHKDLHNKTVHEYSKYKNTIAGKAEKAINKIRYRDNQYANMDYWEPAKTSLSTPKKKKKKK